jgi:hypothetical protein
MGAQISVSDCDACKLARYLGMFQVDAVASAGLHISLHLGEDPDEPRARDVRNRGRALGNSETMLKTTHEFITGILNCGIHP